MSEIIYASIYILIALALYSIGVWSERFAGRLKKWHLLFFWAGLIADSIGTGIMITMRENIVLNLHSVVGYTGITLMFIHTIWATAVLLRNNEKLIFTFHRFSVIVWWIWVFSLVSGVLLGASSVM